MEKVRNNITGEVWSLLDTDRLHPGFSVDCAVLCFHENTLKILLTEFKIDGYWSLPGGFMYNHEDAEQAARRVMKGRTGLEDIALTQFHLFSNPERTVIAQNEKFISENSINKEAEKWLVRRFISLGFYSFVKYDQVTLNDTRGEVVKWYDIDKLPKLYSDHENIIQTALKMMPSLMPIVAIAHALLPEKFTMTELRFIYEHFLSKEFDRRNFQRKILSEGYVIQLDEKEKSKAYNPPYLYSFDTKKMYREFNFDL